MGQRLIFNSTHKPQQSLNETLGFNHGEHLHRMCNETGIPMVVIVMPCARSTATETYPKLVFFTLKEKN